MNKILKKKIDKVSYQRIQTSESWSLLFLIPLEQAGPKTVAHRGTEVTVHC